MRELDVVHRDGRRLHVYDTGDDVADERLVVFWHHGTPNIGAPPRPLFAASAERRVRWISYDRPGYGGSTPRLGRDIASAAVDVAVIADTMGIDRFAVMGHSGGGPHALACAALLPNRVLAATTLASLAPRNAEGLDWYAGMAEASKASLRAAEAGSDVKTRYEASAAFDPEVFTAADNAALEGVWSWLLDVVRPAVAAGPGGLIDDDLAYVAPWGFDPADIAVPTLIVHGAKDRMVPHTHAEWLARRCASAELRLYPDDGHISVLRSAVAALNWLCARCISPGSQRTVTQQSSPGAQAIHMKRTDVALLFSYGSLLLESVQLSTFGRRLHGSPDELVGAIRTKVEITNPQVAATLGTTHHDNVVFNGNAVSRVPGMAFELADEELASVDAYEAAFSYSRVHATLASGRQAWLYVHSDTHRG